ncbi:MAG: hypothetical protein BWY79_01906 [Actinobacteria bacterium ADurb.Bin444]|nr:MAG: hypothetical protein BWY79_01906 [Actinobacteria bacterium ADurb.Bin444]
MGIAALIVGGQRLLDNDFEHRPVKPQVPAACSQENSLLQDVETPTSIPSTERSYQLPGVMVHGNSSSSVPQQAARESSIYQSLDVHFGQRAKDVELAP